MGEVQEWNTRFQKFVFTSAQEFGKVWTNQQQFAESIDHIDINVLAISKLVEELYKNCPMDGAEMKDFDAWYEEKVKVIFADVQEKREEDRVEAKEEMQRELEKQKEASFEETLKQELKEEGSVTVDPSATSEATVPEGATIFGG